MLSVVVCFSCGHYTYKITIKHHHQQQQQHRVGLPASTGGRSELGGAQFARRAAAANDHRRCRHVSGALGWPACQLLTAAAVIRRWEVAAARRLSLRHAAASAKLLNGNLSGNFGNTPLLSEGDTGARLRKSKRRVCASGSA